MLVDQGLLSFIRFHEDGIRIMTQNAALHGNAAFQKDHDAFFALHGVFDKGFLIFILTFHALQMPECPGVNQSGKLNISVIRFFQR